MTTTRSDAQPGIAATMKWAGKKPWQEAAYAFDQRTRFGQTFPNGAQPRQQVSATAMAMATTRR